MQLGSATSQNMEGLVRVQTNNTSANRMGVALRFTASNTFYHARLSANANNVVIGKVVSGTNTDLFTAAFTVSVATFYWIRFRIVGSNLYARVWQDGSGEPASWTVTGTDSSITGSGGFGLTINSTSTASTWDFDSFTVTDATTTVVFPMRAKIATQSTKVFKTRIPVSTKHTWIFKLRAVLTNNTVTKLFKTRTVLSTKVTQIFKMRTKVFGGNTMIFKTRIPVRTVNTQIFKLRFRASITSTKIFKLRSIVRSQGIKPFQLRAVVKAPPLLSGGFTLFANTASGTVSFDHPRFTQFPDPALSLAPVLDRLGTSNVAWNANVFVNTSLGVKTSTDGIHFTTATNGGPIPGLSGQPDPVIDLWTSNTSANYTNTSKSGGSVATVAYDTTNSRITLSGGSGALYLNNAIVDDDIDLICDMDMSDAGGPTWRNQGDGLNYYELGAYDDSSISGFTSQLRLYKVSAGTRSLLGSASSVTWHRNTQGYSPYKRIRITMLSGTITVYFDGAVMQTYTDGSPLAAGKVGLRNDGGSSRYYQLRVQQQGDYVSGTPAGDIVTGKYVYLEQDLATTDPSVSPQVLDTTISARSPNIATGALISQLHDPSKPFAAKYSDEMTALAQASGDYWWDVDQSTGAVTFAERHAVPAPFCLYSTDFLNRPATQSAGGTSGVQPTNSADTYRNQEIVTNTISLVTVSNEEKIANGTDTSWNLAFPLHDAPEITVAGVSKTVGVKGVDTGKDFYWQAANNTISQDSGAAKIPQGYILSFSYVGQYADQVIRNNLAEQEARKAVEGGTGIVVDIVDGQGMLSSNAITYADGLLARNGNNDTVQLIGTTTRPGLAPGIVVPVFLPEMQMNNVQLLIMKLTTSGYQKSDGTVFYEYTIVATNGPNLSNWSTALGL